MSTLPDTTSMLRAVLDAQDMFPGVHRVLPTVTIKLVVDEVKARATDLVFLGRLDQLVGRRDFTLLLDAVPASTLGKAVKAVDRHNPELRGATPDWLRKRLILLVGGAASYEKPPQSAVRPRVKRTEPSGQTAGVKKGAAAKVTDPTKAKSTKAKWDGKNRDSEDV